MSERPQVVLFNPDSSERATWESVLEGAAHVRAAGTAVELARLLSERAADVLVAPCDPRLLDALQRCRGNARLILCGDTLPEGVIDAAGQGYDLRHVAEPQQLRREVVLLGRPRSLMVRHRVGGLTLSRGSGERPAEVLDLSNRGLSFRLELDEQLESYLPGAQLPTLQVLRGEQLVLQADHAHVRYIEQAHGSDGRPFYRIGCELPAHGTAQIPAGKSLRIDDAAMRLGLLRAASTLGGIYLQRTEDEGEGILCEAGLASLAQETLRFDVPSHYQPYDVLRGTFELGGSSYRFLTAVIAPEPLTVRLPAVIEATHRRSAARYRPTDQEPIIAEFASPLFEAAMPARKILEISSTGFSFAIDPKHDLFPPGLRLSRITFRLGSFQLSCSGEVRNFSALGRDGAVRCGVAFVGLSATERTQLADALMRHRFPGLTDGNDFPLEQLWRFFEETRFIYPQKMEQLAPVLPQVHDTFRKLQAKPGRLFKSIVYHEDRQLYAHMSAVRGYAHTFVVQHLAGATRTRGRQAPHIVNLGMTEYFSQSQDLEYVKVYFRPNNKWPARVFGGYARKLTDRQRSDLRTFDYRILPVDQQLPDTPGVRVIEARGSDLSEVEGHFVGSERGLILRSDDLTRSNLRLDAVDELYQGSGLFRRRVVLLALQHDRPVGFALCELSSLGLNLSELLSALRIELLAAGAQGPDHGQSIRTALLREALRFYREAGRERVPLLQAADTEPPLAEALAAKQYACWTCHRTQVRHFSEHVDRLYELLESNAARRAARTAGRAADEVHRGAA